MNEYMQVQAAFEARGDALCENTSPTVCNCADCPARKMCEWLCDNDPFREERSHETE